MKLSRRYGFLQLGSRYELATRLLVAVDISGSMSGQDVARGFSLVNQFFRHSTAGVDVISFDSVIQGQPVTLSKFEIRGRGGTNFAPVIQFIDEHPTYDGLLIFTDCQAPVPPLISRRSDHQVPPQVGLSSYGRPSSASASSQGKRPK